jgi:hypothetical protein
MSGGTATHWTEPAPATSPASNSPSQHDQELASRIQIEYKARWDGSTLHVADRWYPSSKTCSACGAVKTTPRLAERTHRCDQCDFVLDRDLNAARNLAQLVDEVSGRHVLPELRGDGKRARGKPTPDPHYAGSGYRHGKTHGVNAAPQGDGCLEQSGLTFTHTSGNG